MHVPVDDQDLAEAVFACASRAAMAALLNRQKPMPRLALAWCPGGRSGRRHSGLALEHGVDGHASGAAGIVGRLERLPADKRVAGAQPAGARLDVPPHPHQIVARVAGENLIVGRRPWLVRLRAEK